MNEPTEEARELAAYMRNAAFPEARFITLPSGLWTDIATAAIEWCDNERKTPDV